MLDDVLDGMGDFPPRGSRAYYRELQRQSALQAHPDCRDPDHPGCESCMEDEINAAA